MIGRVAIVVEGGAMRGVFAAGVLDVFLERNFDPFDLAIGVSAGACNLASHLAGQHGRNRRSYVDLMTRREFIDARRLLGRRSVLDLDWLWDALADREPLDVDAIVRRSTEFVVVATSRVTGEAVYLRPGPADMFDALKASSALPVLYRRKIVVGGTSLVDGGVADPIPVEEAFRRGARDILVVRTRPAGAVKRYDLSARATAWQLRREPALAAAVRATAVRYQRSVAFLAQPPRGCRIVQVAPPVPLATKRTTQDRRALERDYELGRLAGEGGAAEFLKPVASDSRPST
jgi:predicted patatin/cPLA2 family phospholipase